MRNMKKFLDMEDSKNMFYLYFKYTWGLLAWVFGIVGSIYAMNLMEYSIRKWILFGAAMMILFGGPIIFAYGVLIKKKLMR